MGVPPGTPIGNLLVEKVDHRKQKDTVVWAMSLRKPVGYSPTLSNHTSVDVR